MKVVLVIPANVCFAPYVGIYTNVLKKLGVDYDIISWDRDGREEDCIQYCLKVKKRNTFFLIVAFCRFSSFVKRHIRANKYDRIIVFTPQAAIFLSRFLKKFYKNRYIFDYRDLSIEQKPIFKNPFKCVLKNSYMNVVSSPGFLKYLPSQYDYFLSHNFNIDELKVALDTEVSTVDITSESIDVLTIGGIRDYESNVQVIEHLANVKDTTIRFVGKGAAAFALEEYAKSINATNVTFEGYYPKEKEKLYIKDCTFLNIFYPRKPSHDTALSNRFYNSLIYKRPMITTIDTIQGDYASKYNVGIAISNCNSLHSDMHNFIKNLNMQVYLDNCNKLLKTFMSDYDKWKTKVEAFVSVE